MTGMRNEAEAGLVALRKVLAGNERISLKQIQQFGSRAAFLVVVGTPSQDCAIQVSEEFLHDLPNSQDYLSATAAFFEAAGNRMRCGSPHEFYCLCGIPIRTEISWPLQRMQDRDATYVHVDVHDLRSDSAVAKCSVVLSGQAWVFDLERDPFRRLEVIVRTIRQCVDRGKLKFYTRDKHPPLLQELKVETGGVTSDTELSTEDFEAGKVFWLAFKRGDKRTKTWIADPWDANYLGTDTRTLIQKAQIAEANGLIIVDDIQEFASAGDGLLRLNSSYENFCSFVGDTLGQRRGAQGTTKQYDVFICHASEDKDSFVRPLAQALRNAGYNVWFDEFTLRLGDSLTREINRGLAKSKYGVVVLSPSFFEKQWPQAELDAMVALEGIDGRKRVLPIWHNVDKEDVAAHSPLLAGRLAATTARGLDHVVNEIRKVLEENSGASGYPPELPETPTRGQAQVPGSMIRGKPAPVVQPDRTDADWYSGPAVDPETGESFGRCQRCGRWAVRGLTCVCVVCGALTPWDVS